MKLPLTAVALVLFALSLAELVLLPQASPVPAVIAVHVVVLGTLLLLPRRPVLVLALILLELFAVKELQINQMVSVALSLLGPFAAFAAAALAPTRRLRLIVLLLGLHLAWRATLPSGDAVTIIVTGSLLLSGGRGRAAAARAAPPGDDPRRARGADRGARRRAGRRRDGRAAAHVERGRAAHRAGDRRAARAGLARRGIRPRRGPGGGPRPAADALGEMQATVRTLGSTEPLEPLSPEETTWRRLAEVLGEHGPAEPRRRVFVRRPSTAARRRLRARVSTSSGSARVTHHSHVNAPAAVAPARRAPASSRVLVAPATATDAPSWHALVAPATATDAPAPRALVASTTDTLAPRTLVAAPGAADDPRLRLLAGRVRVLGGQLHVRRRRGSIVVRVAFDSPERRRLRAISPLWLACVLLFAGAVAEQVALDPPGPWALVLPLLALLAPRAPVAAACALAAAARGLGRRPARPVRGHPPWSPRSRCW